MTQNPFFRWPDLLVIVLNLVVMLVIGIYCARKNKSPEAYFLASRNMPGWVVGFSVLATMISSMTFLAIPGFTYQGDWRYVPAHLTYLLAAFAALYLFMPFFRQGHVNSAYEYLERRFGTWARLYGATAFVSFHIFKMGVILYAVCLPIETMSGFPLPWVILVFGVVVAFYTVAGGLEAVIWTDFIQALSFVLGGLICLPVVAWLLPGGMDQILTEAYADGKFTVGSTSLTLSEQTVWAIMLVYSFSFFQMMCTDQMMVQRYCAIRSDREARRGLLLGAFTTVPTWIYFSFLGTALYVLYKNFPRPELKTMLPEQVFPFFILTDVPAGLAGFVISGLIAAAMSTLDSSINALAATVTTDFYGRLWVRNRDERHYLKVGRWVSVAFGGIMIGSALLIYYTRTQTLLDLQTLMVSILSGGVLGLFMLGFLTRRVQGRTALVATLCTFLGICFWLAADSSAGRQFLPGLADALPDKFWIMPISNVSLFVIGYTLSIATRRRSAKDLTNLTVWSRRSPQVPEASL